MNEDGKKKPLHKQSVVLQCLELAESGSKPSRRHSLRVAHLYLSPVSFSRQLPPPGHSTSQHEKGSDNCNTPDTVASPRPQNLQAGTLNEHSCGARDNHDPVALFRSRQHTDQCPSVYETRSRTGDKSIYVSLSDEESFSSFNRRPKSECSRTVKERNDGHCSDRGVVTSHGKRLRPRNSPEVCLSSPETRSSREKAGIVLGKIGDVTEGRHNSPSEQSPKLETVSSRMSRADHRPRTLQSNGPTFGFPLKSENHTFRHLHLKVDKAKHVKLYTDISHSEQLPSSEPALSILGSRVQGTDKLSGASVSANESRARLCTDGAIIRRQRSNSKQMFVRTRSSFSAKQHQTDY